ncbi:MAG TPA: ClbS/DfsB family four-helix bundle protein [Ktedonobacterales bacterium]|jgi:hypothetical protein
MTKDELLRAFADAYEQLMATAIAAEQRGVGHADEGWGPREIVAHLAGWEMMATVRVPAVAGGMAPIEFADEAQNRVMNDAINAAFVALVGDQPLEAICGVLRRAYQRDLAFLQTLDERFFQPGEYVYGRTYSVIEHCQEHSESLMPAAS